MNSDHMPLFLKLEEEEEDDDEQEEVAEGERRRDGDYRVG